MAKKKKAKKRKLVILNPREAEQPTEPTPEEAPEPTLPPEPPKSTEPEYVPKPCDTCRRTNDTVRACPECGMTYCDQCRTPSIGHYKTCQNNKCGAKLP